MQLLKQLASEAETRYNGLTIGQRPDGALALDLPTPYEEDYVMPLDQLQKMFRPETLSLMDSAMEQAWQELKHNGEIADAKATRRQLRTTIVALASVGETDKSKLKRFALHAARA
jgi:hypothetical protein